MTTIPAFVIRGAIRSKKTSQKIISIPRAGAHECRACGHRPGFPKIMPSDAYKVWHDDAMPQCAYIADKLRRRGVELPIVSLVNVRAMFYQDVDRADVQAMYESLADLLQDAQILQNDRLIASWNGSLRLKDAARPRIEVELTIVAERAVNQELFAGVRSC